MDDDANTLTNKAKLLAKLRALPPIVQAVILGKAIAKHKAKASIVDNAKGA